MSRTFKIEFQEGERYTENEIHFEVTLKKNLSKEDYGELKAVLRQLKKIADKYIPKK